MISSYIERMGGAIKCCEAIVLGMFLSVLVAACIIPPVPTTGKINVDVWNEVARLNFPDRIEIKEYNPQRLIQLLPKVVMFHLKVNFPTEKDTQLFFESIDANGWKHVGGNHLYKKQMQNGKELELRITRTGNEVSLDMKEI